MTVSVCPADNVAAPIEAVWALLEQPTQYEEWADAHLKRVVPEGPATPGQIIYMWTSEFGRRWDVRIIVRGVDPNKHQVQFDTYLPLGIVAHNTITCTPIDAHSCRVQYG